MARPFYLVGHNTNSIQEIRDGLASGLNAFEIDVNRDANDQLFVAHDFVEQPSIRAPNIRPPQLDVFLSELRQLALSREGAGMALLIIDSKVRAPALGAKIARSVRANLTDNSRLLPVIYSVAKVADAQTFFGPIHDTLASNEGLMIDEEPDPAQASHFFQGLGVRRGCWGNGVTTIAGIGLPTPNLPVQMDAGVAIRAVGNLRFVYPWVLREPSTIAEFVRIGVNGVMVDTGQAAGLVGVLRRPEFAAHVRSATRADDPFADDRSPLLQIQTADVAHAGTDARITFTLELDGGRTIKKSVDAAFNGRFERGSLNFVLLQNDAFSIAEVRAVTVVHDGSGNAPDWELATITLRRRGEQDRIAAFHRVVSANSAARVQL
ncbi:MAG TPA: PLAT/LH2 domain-containing protein [Polyangiaceae bacterium]|nr:PLAT/LH2 domain-containing protein [Polyangiaceae bacterium]